MSTLGGGGGDDPRTIAELKLLLEEEREKNARLQATLSFEEAERRRLRKVMVAAGQLFEEMREGPGDLASGMCVYCHEHADKEKPYRGHARTCVWLHLAKALHDAVLHDEEQRYQWGDAIHHWFELTYAEYLTIPRSVLQSMPDSWGWAFVELLTELDLTIDWRPQAGYVYRVGLFSQREEFDEDEGRHVMEWHNQVPDELMDYQRGRRRIPHRTEKEGV